MLAYPINHPVRLANDLRSTMLGDNAYAVPLNQSEKGIAAYNKNLRDHGAHSDKWDNFEFMLNPLTAPLAGHLSPESAEEFVKNLSRDRYLGNYLRKTSRQMLTSRPVKFLHTHAA